MTKKKPKKKHLNRFITNLKELDAALEDGKYQDFCIILAGGAAYSRKEILPAFKGKKQTKAYFIMNCIDGTTQTLTEKQIMNPKYTNIGKAMSLRSFIAVHEDYWQTMK